MPHDLVLPAVAEGMGVLAFVTFDRSDLWVNFCPTKVSLYGVGAAVAFSDAGPALKAARPHATAHSSLGRRAALWINQGYRALRIAENCVAQDVRRPVGRP
ncbi:hypothetical protein [Streptomyces sp. NPDC059398]|uniref:hypothetical protein n=1 Tax=Streptomyces sp. NPDC059398 TaxID=3346820 RepID=UPI00369FF94B